MSNQKIDAEIIPPALLFSQLSLFRLQKLKMKLTSIFFASVAASEIVPFGFTECWTTFKRELKKCDRLNEPEDQLMCLFDLFKSSSMCLLESLCDRFDEVEIN